MRDINDLKETGNNIKFGETDYDVYNLDEFETVKLKNTKTKNNGKIVADCIVVDSRDIKTKNRPHQTRVRDIVDRNLSDLTSQIKEDGLLNILTVMWDGKEFVLLGGHHRLSALWNIHYTTQEDPDVPCMVPVCVLDFPTKEDEHEFCQQDNNHPPRRNHTHEDAKKMLEDKEKLDAFKNMDKKQKELQSVKYLMNSYAALVPTIKKAQNLYKKLQAAPRTQSYITPMAAEVKAAQKAAGHITLTKDAGNLQANGTVALCGTTGYVGSHTVGNFRKSFWNRFKNCPEQKFAMKLTTHVQVNKTTSPKTIVKARADLLQFLANENNMMYLPTGRGHVEEVLILAQIKDGIEQNALYVWKKGEFEFSRNI